jgi:sulfide dehydrogenase cytochrome subunit
MQHRHPILALAALACGIASAAPPTPAMLTNSCAGCHGIGGASAGPSMPNLAGQSKQAIVEAMKNFKSGERPSTLMGRLAKGYTDAQFEAMGEYFSSQKLHTPKQSLDAAKVARGAAIERTACAGCHPDAGRRGVDEVPALAGQWLPYLQMQMQLFVAGTRKMPEPMAQQVKALSAADIDALMQFYASVK